MAAAAVKPATARRSTRGSILRLEAHVQLVQSDQGQAAIRDLCKWMRPHLMPEDCLMQPVSERPQNTSKPWSRTAGSISDAF
jgi:hypothetical protein